MTKHIRGKHSHGKHAPGAEPRPAQAGRHHPSSKEAGEAAPAAEVSEQAAEGGEGSASSDGSLAGSDAAAPEVPGAGAERGHEEPDGPSGTTEVTSSADGRKDAPDEAAASEPSGKGHATPAEEPPVAAPPGVAAVAAQPAKGGARKAIAIVAGVAIGVLAVVYLAGVLVFSGRFFPHTHAASFDFSLETPEAAQGMLQTALDGYAFEVKGADGFDMIFTAADIAMDMDAAQVAEDMLASMNQWLWPWEVFRDHDETAALVASCATDAIVEKVQPEVELRNQEATAPVDASIAYDPEARSFVVSPEEYGTTWDAEAIAAEVASGIMTFEPVIELSEDAYVKPAVYRDDARLARACQDADAMLAADFDVTIGGQVAGTVDADTISQWIVLDDELVATLDDEQLVAWATDLVDRNSTLGSERTYTRADGKVVTVSGGTYGWRFDGDGVVDIVRQAVLQGEQGAFDVPVSQSAARVVTDEHPDWPARYCDVDLSEQYARFYDDGGALIWEAPIVSGKPGAQATPQGVYVVNYKESPSVLKGQIDPETGEPTYTAHVKYWMPFVGNLIGLHDASWQSAFGGSRYRNGYGSKGCVNLPTPEAGALWDIIRVGDVVVVHY